MKLKDISVSRFHASIALSEKKELLIIDNQSKFGTLILMRTALKVFNENPIHLQSGRAHFKFKIKWYSAETFPLSLCCQYCLFL